MPVIRVTAVVRKGEDAKIVRENPVINGVGKARDEVVPDICLYDAPTVRSLLNDAHRAVGTFEKLGAKGGNSSVVKLSGLNEFRLGIGMINQSHPIARRAASMTSS